MAEQKGRTEIAELGEFGLIDELTKNFKSACKSTIVGIGDDAAVIEASIFVKSANICLPQP